tara:strand:+ start:281 stop:616 length:336 start_codon:yes stop_codon:yes gene_type:complete
MVKKYPSLHRNNGFGRIKYYLENPVNIELDNEMRYQKIYDATIRYLNDFNDDHIDDLVYLYKGLKSISELIYNMYGYTRLTNYILFRFNKERKEYYQDKNLKLPELDTVFY